MNAPASTRGRAGADVISAVRRSILGVRTPASGGTGWVVLASGLVLTSHEAVGYQTDVLLERESNRRAALGRVIWVDVARDLALVLPREPLGIPPILSRPDLPKLGEPVLAVTCDPNEPLRVVSALVSAVDHKISSIRCFEVDSPLGFGGCPIIDLDGRVVGIGALDLPRGARRQAAAARSRRASPALPISALHRALAAFDVSADQFEERSPIYRCPGCTEPYVADYDRCLACGRVLPHAWDPEGAPAPDASEFAFAERFLRDLLARLGASSAQVRTGPRVFRLLAPSPSGGSQRLTEVTAEIDATGRAITLRTPLVRVPAAHHESFYRFLLTLNDETTGRLRLFIEDDCAHLGLAEPVALVSEAEAADLFEDLVRVGEHYRKSLAELFEARAISS